MIVIGKVSNTTSPKYEKVDSVDNLNATDNSIGKDQKKSSKACSNGSDRQAVKSNATNQKAQAKDKKCDCSAENHIQEGTKGNIHCLNGKLVVEKCSKASGGNPVMRENSESMHKMGIGEKSNFDPLISGSESFGNMLSDIFSDSDNKRANSDPKEEKNDEELEFQSGISDELLVSIVEQCECDSIKIPPSSPLKPIVDNCSQYKSHETAKPMDNHGSDSAMTASEGTSNMNSRSGNNGSHSGSAASKSTSDSSTSATKAESDKKRGES